MNYKYDPILCMNIPVSKSNDAVYEVRYDDALGDTQVHKFATEEKAKEYIRRLKKDSVYAKKIKLNGRAVDDATFVVRGINGSTGKEFSKQFNSESEAKAFANEAKSRGHESILINGKAADEDIKLVKTVASKNGYAVHVVEGSHGQRVVLTFKGESYKNPHMWLGVASQSNINSAVKTMEEFAKAKDSKAIDKALRICDENKSYPYHGYTIEKFDSCWKIRDGGKVYPKEYVSSDDAERAIDKGEVK